jgi:hypothetical protein
MNKDFKSNLRVDLVSNFDNFKEFVTWHLFVLLVRVDNINQRTTLLKGDNIFWILFTEFFRSWEIFYLKLNVSVIIDVSGLYLLSIDEEERFVGRHLLEDNSLNRCFAWFGQAHENDIHIILKVKII